MDANICIRPMKAEDLSSVSSLYREMYQEQAQMGMLHRFRESEVEAMLSSQLKSKLFMIYVAERNEQLGGFIIGGLSRFGSKFSYGEQPLFGCIHDLYISRSMRQSGIGQQLLHTVENVFRDEGIELIELQVLENNEAGQSFWKRNGYNDVVRMMYKKL